MRETLTLSGRVLLVAAALLAMIKDAVAVECYKCTYLPFRGDSQSACSDPWPWYRESFPDLAPPTEMCLHACVKIVMYNQNSRSSIVRDCAPAPCGEMRNETYSDTTASTCCEGDLCNSTESMATSWRLVAVSLFAVVVRARM